MKEADDGYLFSRSIHGRNLSEKEKNWVVLENEGNVWKDHTDKDGKLLYRLKSCIDTFRYRFKETDPETGREAEKTFSVTEKRIVSYNPALAKKQTAKILKMAGKASNYVTYKKMTREENGISIMPFVLADHSTCTVLTSTATCPKDCICVSSLDVTSIRMIFTLASVPLYAEALVKVWIPIRFRQTGNANAKSYLHSFLFINSLIPSTKTAAPINTNPDHRIFQYGEVTSNIFINNSFQNSNPIAIANKSNST